MSKFYEALEHAERERALRDGRAEDRTVPAATIGVAGGDHRVVRTLGPEPVVDLDTPLTFHGVDEHLVSLLRPASAEAECYRSLRYAVEQAKATSGVTLVGISSPAMEDGKTTTALNLGGALSQSADARVLVIDADLRRPSVSAHLGLPDDLPGLVDAILDPRLPIRQAIHPCPPFNFDVLTAGRPAVTPYEILQSARFSELLHECRRSYDYVVLDTPPVVPLPDPRVVGQLVDGFLLVVAANKTPRRLVEEALQILTAFRVIGLVFNLDDQSPAHYYEYGSQSARASRRAEERRRPSGLQGRRWFHRT